MQTLGLKVLIIEDRRENIVFLANNIFKPKGFEILTARDGKAGLRKALEENPNLIITDLNLPRMGGLDIMADLQDRGAKVPFIVMTLHGSEETAVRAFRLGAKDYLVKPLRVEDVEMALERALAEPEQTAMMLSEADQAKSLGEKIKQLDETILQQEKQLKLHQAEQEPARNLKQKLQTQEKQLQEALHETAHLNTLLQEQKQLTTEARNRAKALTQFIIAQHKEMIWQRKCADKLTKQVAILSDGVSKLATRLEKQTDQLQRVSSNTDNPDKENAGD